MAGTDTRIDKRRVTMTSVRLLPNGETATESCIDYIRPEHLDVYMADAATRWQSVQVSDEFDAGPGGFDGMTCVPSGLNLPDAGVIYPATNTGPTMLLSDPTPWVAPVGCPSPDADLAGFMAFHRAQFGTATMIASGTGLRNTLYSSYVGAATFADVYSTTGATAAGTAISGGTPAYASKGLTWGAGTNGVGSTGGTVFDIPSGGTVAGFGVKTGLAGAYLDGGALTSQAFASQGTYTLTLTYTQT